MQIMEKKCHNIREIKKYTDDEGRSVLEYVQVFGKDPAPSIIKGEVMIRFNVMGPGGQPMPQTVRLEFIFPDVTGVKAAFEKFDDVAKAEVEAWKKDQDERMKASRVISAKQMPTLMGPDGKPMK